MRHLSLVVALFVLAFTVEAKKPETLYNKRMKKKGGYPICKEYKTASMADSLRLFNYNSRGFHVEYIQEIDKIYEDHTILEPVDMDDALNRNYEIHVYDLKIGQQRTVRFYYYRSKLSYINSQGQSEATNPLMILSPSIKGVQSHWRHALETRWAETYAEAGINSIIMTLEEDMFVLDRPFDKLDQWMIDQVIPMRMMIDFVERELSDEVNPEKIGAMGASLGGIRTVMLTALEPKRIKGAISIVAGANFPDLWVNSKQEELVLYRNHRIEVEGITEKAADIKADQGIRGKISLFKKKDYSKELKWIHDHGCEVSRIDPLLYVDNRPNFNKDIFMVMSGRDSKVRTKNQAELWHAVGRPKNYVVFSKLNHRPTIVASSSYLADHMISFLKFRLDGAEQPAGVYFGDLAE